MKQPCLHRPRGGFTLIELLVVMTIMAILLALGTAAMRNVGGTGVSTAVAQAEAWFSEARALAMGQSTHSRVLIDIDDAESDNYLRRVVIVSQPLDEDGMPQDGQWSLAREGFLLPNGIYFSRRFSHRHHGEGTGQLDEMTLSGVSSFYEGRYLYYEFNAEGICTTGRTGEGGYSGPGFVVASGVRDPGGDPRTTGDARRNFGGFVIWRNGSTSIFRDPGQIIGNTEPTDF
jgi:prepilin-type N-terminal cleavage/methylation domain-containing protein